LAHHVRQNLQAHSQVTLRELTESQPLRHGLAEPVAYLQRGSEVFKTVVDEETPEVIVREASAADGLPVHKNARLPRIIFVR